MSRRRGHSQRRALNQSGSAGDPTAFRPDGLSGLEVWLDATVGVTTGATFTWADQSGHGRDATQTVAILQPTYNMASLNWNNMPCVTYDPTIGQYLVCDGAGDLASGDDTPLTVVTAFRLSTVETLTRAFLNWGNGTIGLNSWYLGTDTLTQALESRIEDGVAGVATVLAGSTIDTVRHTNLTVCTGGIVSSYMDGTALFVNQAFDVATITTTTLTIGNIREVFGTRGMKGDIAEMCIYSRALSNAEQTKITNYFRHKWGT